MKSACFSHCSLDIEGRSVIVCRLYDHGVSDFQLLIEKSLSNKDICIIATLTITTATTIHKGMSLVYKTSSLATVPSKEKTKVSIAESADRSSHFFLQMKKNEVSAPFISGFNKLMSISMHYYSS